MADINIDPRKKAVDQLTKRSVASALSYVFTSQLSFHNTVGWLSRMEELRIDGLLAVNGTARVQEIGRGHARFRMQQALTGWTWTETDFLRAFLDDYRHLLVETKAGVLVFKGRQQYESWPDESASC